MFQPPLHLLLLTLLLCSTALAQEPNKTEPNKAEPSKTAAAEKKPDFEKWEKNIAGIEKKAAENKDAKESIMFVGSSSIVFWDLKQSFPNLKTLNHGFGGSHIADSVHFFDRLVLPTAPKTIVFYAGDNDIASGKSPEKVFADFQALAALVKEKLPHSKMIYVAIKPSPSRWKLYEKQATANRLIREAIEKDAERFTFLDIIKPMLNEQGEPRPELFKPDMLHMNPTGYAIWNQLLLSHLATSSAK